MKKILQNVLEYSKDWFEIEKKILKLVSSKELSKSQAGTLFEFFAKYYFLVDPGVCGDYKNVWLYSEIPLSVRRKLGFSGIEHGVDLLLKDHDDRFTAIQCKFRFDRNSNLSWSKDKIANLFGYAIKADLFAVFTNASSLDKISKSRSERFVLYSISNLLGVEELTYKNIVSRLKNEKIRSAKFKPRNYQKMAVDSVYKHFQNNDRGQLIMPCGTGKTLISLWIKEKLQAKNTLVLFPSLALLRQTKNEWARHRNEHYSHICVCSEKDIDKVIDYDKPLIHSYEVGGIVTTEPKEIATFLNKKGAKVIFSTYQSLSSVQMALSKNKATLDLAISDEAHKTAGTKLKNLFTLIHDKEKIPVKKRLYMTATPKIVAKRLKTILGEDVKYLCDMNDQAVYGKEAYRMSFKDAIDEKILTDYRIIAVGITDKELQREIKKRTYVSKNVTIEDYANNYSLRKIMNKNKSCHAITFHSRVAYAKNFSERHSELYPNIFSEYVSGKQTSTTRAMLLKEFESSNIAVMSNARCLTEGIDVPVIDTIYFCDPKYSKIDIVQASGRALRKAKSGNKRLGFIVIPIYHRNVSELEKAVKRGVFKNLVQVVRSLADQDERLQDEIDRIIYDKGQRKKARGHMVIDSKSSELIKLEGFRKKLRESIFTQIIERNVNNWAVQYKYLLDYRKKFPNRWPVLGEEYLGNNNLGNWVSWQKGEYGRGILNDDRIQKLNAISFPWEPTKDKWLRQFNTLLDFRKKHPERWPFRWEEWPKGNKIGAWVKKQRVLLKNNTKDWRFKKLYMIGFSWDPQKESWLEQYKYLCNFRKKFPKRWPKREEDFPRGNRLEPWCNRQKTLFNHNRLQSWKVKRLEKIGFPWDLKKQTWKTQFELLKKYRENNPRSWPVPSEEYPKGNKLGHWCSTQRVFYKKKKLSDNKIKLLETIGFDFNPLETNWLKNFEYLSEYKNKFGCWPSISTKYPKRNELGGWARSQRDNLKRNNLKPWQTSELKKIGFSSKSSFYDDYLDKKWMEQYKLLCKYKKRFPGRWPKTRDEFPKGNKLGQWYSRQKILFVNNQLTEKRIKLLKIIGLK